MPTFPCPLAVNCECADDNPFANLSAEAVDKDTFFAIVVFEGDPPLGGTWEQLGCKTVCTSTISQDDADECALRQAQECAWGGGRGWRTPPTLINPHGTRRQIFSNSTQVCESICDDGTIFTKVIPAGTILAFSQAKADELAASQACKLAVIDRICLSDIEDFSCQNSFYDQEVVALTQNAPPDGQWNVVAGDLPTGLSLSVDPDDVLVAFITGTPTVLGTFTFTLEFAASTGSNTRTYTITVGGITSNGSLPDGTQGTAYNQVLSSNIPGTVTWSVIAGGLPDGLTLDPATGLLSGTPTTAGTFAFTIEGSNS